MQSNSAHSVLPKPALLLFLLLLLLLQPLLHLPTPFSNFSNPSPPFSKSVAWQPLQPSSQPSSQVSPHNKSTLALFHTSPPSPSFVPIYVAFICHFPISQISESPSLELLSIQPIKINMLFYGWWILNCVVFLKWSWDIQRKGHSCFDIAWIIYHTS